MWNRVKAVLHSVAAVSVLTNKTGIALVEDILELDIILNATLFTVYTVVK